MTLFLSPEVNFRFYRRKTGSYLKIVERPLNRRAMIDFLMKIYGTIPWKCRLPVLFLKTDKTGSTKKIVYIPRTFGNFLKNAPSETGFRDLLDELFNLVYTVKNRFLAKCHSLFLSPICFMLYLYGLCMD